MNTREVRYQFSLSKRITEWLRQGGTSGDHLVQLSAQNRVSYSRLLSFEYFYGWRLHNFSGQPVLPFDHPHSKKGRYYVYMEFLVFQFMLIAFWSVTAHDGEEPEEPSTPDVSQQGWAKEKDHLPQSAGDALSNAAQGVLDFFAVRYCCWFMFRSSYRYLGI